MIHARRLILPFVLVGLITFAADARGQVQTGTPPFGSFSSAAGSAPDTVNLYNLNVHLTIPIVSKPGRGLPFSYALTYDSSIWYPSNGAWAVVNGYGWGSTGAGVTGYVSASYASPNCPYDGGRHLYDRWTFTTYHDPSGTPHSITPNIVLTYDNGNICVTSQMTGRATLTDGSGYTLSLDVSNDYPDATITTPHGISISAPVTGSGNGVFNDIGTFSVTDSNGNSILTNVPSGSGPTTFTDTLGTTALSISTAASPYQYTYLTTNPSSPASVSVSSSVPVVTPSFGCGLTANPTYLALYQTVGLPGNGGQYSLTYDTYGRLQQITYPTGGYVRYVYGSVNCSDGSVLSLDRYVSPDGTAGSEQHWSYSRTLNGTTSTTTATNPANDVTTITFQNGFETLRTVQDHQMGVVQTVVTCYNGMGIVNCPSNGPSTGIFQVDSYTELPSSAGRISGATTKYDTNNYSRVTETDEYDFGSTGSGVAGSLLRQTLTNYAALTNIYDRPSSVTVNGYNSQNPPAWGQIAQTSYDYSGLYGSHGNPTTISRWVSGSNYLSTIVSYNSNGTIASTQDPNGSSTSYQYTCNASLPSTVTYPAVAPNPSMTSSTGYDCSTGLVTSQTDLNGNVTNYRGYDALLRLGEIDYPDGGIAKFYYPDANTEEETHLIDSVSNLLTDAKIRVDGLGRTISRVATNGETSPGTSDQTDTCYDLLGRVSFTSYPYQSSGSLPSSQSCTTAGDTASYDALNRVIQVQHSDSTTVLYGYSDAAVSVQDEGNGTRRVQRVAQMDGLGRTSAVCEVTSVNLPVGTEQPVACGLDIPATGFKTTYSWDSLGNVASISQGAQTRSYTYDGLSRVLTAKDPELPNATVQYAYDGPSSIGDLYQVTRPQPNQVNAGTTVTTTYQYDVLHRVYSISTPDSVTPSKSFTYDVNSVLGHSLALPAGRLVSEQAQTPAGTVTDVFDYDAMGRATKQWECSPNKTCSNNGGYLVQYGYDKVGDLTGLTYPDGTQVGYGYNVAPRITSVTSTNSGGPGTLLSGVHYNAFGSPSSDSMGNGINEAYTYKGRGWLQTMASSSPTATPSTGTVTISGSEGQRINTNATSGTGSVTISGTEQATQATHSSLTLSVWGAEQSICTRYSGDTCTNYIYDTGSVSVTVNGCTTTATYGSTSTQSSVASALLSGFSCGTVTATRSGGSLTFTSVGTGSGTNYYYSTTAVTNKPSQFDGPSFYTNSTSGYMSGGTDPVYDSGTITLTVGGHVDTYTWSGQDTTPNSIASGLATRVNGDGSALVTASASNATVTLTAKISGASTNYSLSSSTTYDTLHFAHSSFSLSNGSALTGGADATYIYDSVTVTATVNGTPYSKTYGQGSTNTSIASDFAGYLQANSALVHASASSNVVTLTSIMQGSLYNYSLAASTVSNNGFSPPSFSATASGANMTGGTGGTVYNLTLDYEPNGNVKTASDSNGNWAYGYDDFNRLLNSNLNSGQQTFTYDYDRYGNRWHQNAPQGGPAPQYSFDTTSNRTMASGMTYDAAGNVMNDGTYGYSWDADGMLVSTGSTSYFATGAGLRRSSHNGSTVTDFIHDLSGRVIQTFDANGNVQRTEVFAAGRHLVSYVPGTARIAYGDWLRTERVRTDTSGNVIGQFTSFPFGDGLNSVGNSPIHFTGLENDAESNTEHAWFRQYSSTQGRWLTPDPAGLIAVDITNPQSWNRYAYVGNNPLSYIDPTGLVTYCPIAGARGLSEGCQPDTGGGQPPPAPGDCFDSLLDGTDLGTDCPDSGDQPHQPTGPGQQKRQTQAAVVPPPAQTQGCEDQLQVMRSLVDAVRTGSSEVKGLAQRFAQILRGPKNPNNIIEFQNRQRQLQSKIQDYRDSGCGEPPADITGWSMMPTASPWVPPNRQNFAIPSWVAPAALVTGTACAFLVPGCLEVEMGAAVLIP